MKSVTASIALLRCFPAPFVQALSFLGVISLALFLEPALASEPHADIDSGDTQAEQATGHNTSHDTSHDTAAMAHQPSPQFIRENALAISQATLGDQVGDYRFVDSSGVPVSLHDYLGKPLVISLIYTSCFHICPTTTSHLREVVETNRGVLGEDSFNVVSIGFDVERDSPYMMGQFGKKQSVDGDHWQFLSGDAESISGIAGDLGFTFFPSPNGFDHLIQTSVITADGEVYTHVYGMDFPAPLVIEPLKNLIFGGDEERDLVQDITDRFRLFCTVYDPSRDRYRIDYSIFIGSFIAFLCVGLFGFQLFREWRLYLRSTVGKASSKRSSE